MIEPMQDGGRTVKSRSGDTIERILAAAEAEFARKGLQAGRVQDIARTAGVSKQIIYTYYGVKEGLYQAIIERITDRHEALFTDAKYDELDPRDAISLFVSRMFDVQKRNGGHLLLDVAQFRRQGIDQSKKSPRLVKAITRCIERILARGQDAGLFLPDIDTPKLIWTINILTNGSVLAGGFLADMMGMDFPEDRMVDHCVEHLLRSLERSR